MSGLQKQVTTKKEEKCRHKYKHAKTKKIAQYMDKEIESL